MNNKKSPLEGMTITDFRLLLEDPLVTLGRALAPKVNAELRKMARDIPAGLVPPEDYCPGCGEISWDAPDLCPECLALNADE